MGEIEKGVKKLIPQSAKNGLFRGKYVIKAVT